MNWFMRILGLIGTAALGYASVFIIYVIGLYAFNLSPADEHLYAFKTLFFGGGLMSVIIGTGLGVMRFFTAGLWRILFIWIPVLLPLIYCIYMMVYFSLNG